MTYILYFIIFLIIVMIFMSKGSKRQNHEEEPFKIPTSFKISVVKNLRNRERGLKAIVFRPDANGLSEILVGHYASHHKDIVQYDSEGRFKPENVILAYTWSPHESIDVPVAGGGSFSGTVYTDSKEHLSWFIERVNPLVLTAFSK